MIFNAEKTDGGDAFTGIIRFNRVTLNEGSGMSDLVFTAPIAGHYKMSFSAMSGYKKYGTSTYVGVYLNLDSLVFWIADDNDGRWSDGNNISHDWIMKLKEGDKLHFVVKSGSYLLAKSGHPVNFNGQLVFAEA